MLSLFLEMTEVGKESALASQANPESVRLFKRPRARAAPSYLRYVNQLRVAITRHGCEAGVIK